MPTALLSPVGSGRRWRSSPQTASFALSSRSTWTNVGALNRSLRSSASVFCDSPEMRVCHETIYQALYVPRLGELHRSAARGPSLWTEPTSTTTPPRPTDEALRRANDDDLRPSRRDRFSDRRRPLGRRSDHWVTRTNLPSAPWSNERPSISSCCTFLTVTPQNR